MTNNRTKLLAVYVAAALSLFSLTASPALARHREQKADYQVVGTATLQEGKINDLFLRRNDEGHTFLYVPHSTAEM